jgi:hypothetical protein
MARSFQEDRAGLPQAELFDLVNFHTSMNSKIAGRDLDLSFEMTAIE